MRSRTAPADAIEAMGAVDAPIVVDLHSSWVAGTLAVLGVVVLVALVRQLRQVPRNLLVLMGIAGLEMIGLFVVVPLLPIYVKAFREQGDTLFGAELGLGKLTALVVASYTIAQLLAAPFWGRLSDRRGRRPALLMALLMSAGAFLLFGIADSLWLLVLSRVVQGAGGGTVAVVQAYVADAVPPEQRAKALGWLSAATSLGVALGPVLGSLSVQLGELDLSPADGVQGLGRAAPGAVAAALCVVNAVCAWRWLAESRARPTTPRPAGASPFAAVKRVLTQPRLPAARLLFTYAIAIGAAQGVNFVVVLYLERRFGVDEGTIWLYFTYTAELAVISRTQLLGPLVDRLGEARLSRIGITTLAAGLGLLPFAASLPALALVAALLPVGMALTFPCLTSLLSRVVSADERGLWMGLQQTFGGAMRLCAPLAYGWAWDELGPAQPFWLAGGVVLATLVFGTGVATPPRRAAA